MESRSKSIEVISNVMIVACGLRYLAAEKLSGLECDFGISKSSAYVAKDIFIDAVLQCPDLEIAFLKTTKSSVLLKASNLKLLLLYFKDVLGH